MNRTGAYGIDPHPFRQQVEREAARYLPKRTFGKTVGKAGPLAHHRLVGGIDYHSPATRRYDSRHSGLEGMESAVEIGFHHEVKLFLGGVEHGVAAVYARVAEYRSKTAESLFRHINGSLHLGGIARVGMSIESIGLCCELLAGSVVDIRKGHIPALRNKLPHRRSPYTRATPGDKYRFLFHS